MARFVNAQVPEVVQPFWAALQPASSSPTRPPRSGLIASRAHAGWSACGGVRPRRGRGLKGRCLTFAEREEIALARAGGETMRAIARRLGRSPSTISREVAPQRRPLGVATGPRRRTRSPMSARAAPSRPSWPPTSRCASSCTTISRRRRLHRQIAGRLRRRFPNQPEMRVSTETIYQSLYVQSRGALKRGADHRQMRVRPGLRPIISFRPGPADEHLLKTGRRRALAGRRRAGGRTKQDGVVRWQGAVVPEAECVEVTGSHVGLAVNRQAYRAIAQALARPELEG